MFHADLGLSGRIRHPLEPEQDCTVYAESLDLGCRKLIRVRGRHVAGCTIKPGRLMVLERGLAVHGPPSRGPVLGVALARLYPDAYDPGEIALILRQGIVIPDGDLAPELEPVRVGPDGRFVATGGEILENAVSCRGAAVDLNL